MASRGKAIAKKRFIPVEKRKIFAPRKKRAVVARKKALALEHKKMLPPAPSLVDKAPRKKTPFLLPSETMSFSMVPPENLPVEALEGMGAAVPMLPEFSPEAELAKMNIQQQADFSNSMRTHGSLVTPPETAVGDAPPGSADTLLTAHEMEEYGLADATPQPEIKTEAKTEGKACKRWWGFCLSPRQSFWAGTFFGFAAMSLLTVSLWVLVANNAVQAALR